MRGILLALLLAQISQQPQNATVTVTARNAITQRGIPGVFVTLTLKFPLEPAGASTSVRTDEGGRAVFNLPAGNYQVRAEEQRHVLTAAVKDVLLDPGERRALEIRFNPQAVLVGRVQYANGEPAARVNVSAASVRYRLGQGTLTANATEVTNDRGEFRVSVPPGEYYVRIDNSSSLGRGPHTVSRTVFHPGVSTLSEAKTISIRGESVDVGIVTLPRIQVFSISGTVANAVPAPGGNNRSRAAVYLVSADPANTEEPIRVQTESPTSTNPAELPFRIEGIVPGSYVVYATLQTSASAVSSTLMERTETTVVDRDITGLRIAVKPNIDLPVRVLVIGDRSAVNLDDLSFLLQAQDRIQTGIARPPRLNTLTGDSIFAGLGNNLRFGIRVYGLSGNAHISDIRQGSRSVFKDATIEANLSSGSVEIEVRTQGGSIQGVVRDNSNQPAAQATVLLLPDPAHRKNRNLYNQVTTNSNGQFQMRGIAPGQYGVFALSKAQVQEIDDPSFISTYEGRLTRLSISEGARIETALRVLP